MSCFGDDKEDLIRDVLEKLSDEISDPEDPESLKENLTTIYSGNYRHSYSYLFDVIYPMLNNESLRENVVIILNNIETIHKELLKEKGSEDPVVGSVGKMWDHINLEFRRYSAYSILVSGKGIDQSIQNEFSSLRSNIADTNSRLKNIDDAAVKMIDVDRKLERNTITSITSISIFAAIVMTFAAEISFDSAVLSRIQESTFSETAFSLSLTGFVFFTTIMFLMMIIVKMNDKSIPKQYVLGIIMTDAVLIGISAYMYFFS